MRKQEDKNVCCIKGKCSFLDLVWEGMTHLFHCETSCMFSQQQIYLLYLQAPPLIKIGDMSQRQKHTYHI